MFVNFVNLQKKTKSVKKSPEAGEKSQDAAEGLSDSSAESVIADEAFQLLQLILKRAVATFSRIHRQSLWGNTGNAVIGRVRDSLTRVLLVFVLNSVLSL